MRQLNDAIQLEFRHNAIYFVAMDDAGAGGR